MSEPVPPPLPAATLNYYSAAQPSAPYIERQGNTLITPTNVTLPDACIKCGQPSDGIPIQRKLSWHAPALFILILFPGLLIYLIVALIVRKKATVRMFLCTHHRRARLRNILIAWGIAAAGLVIAILGGMNKGMEYLIPLGILAMIVSLIVGLVVARLITPKKIDERVAVMSGFSSQYLNAVAPQRN